MPKRQCTDAQMARLRQAGTGERYTEALRFVRSGRSDRFVMFSARGAGWNPITQRAVEQLRRIWPAAPALHWDEKFGGLRCVSFPWMDAPDEAAAVVRKALTEAATTCQTCPSPGRKRVVWIWDVEYGWIMPWVKTCCDRCYFVPRDLTDDQQYRYLVEEYEEPEPEPDEVGCCEAFEEVASEVRAEFDRGGMSALLAKLDKLCESMWRRSAHYDAYSGHAVVMAVEKACAPLLHRVSQVGVLSEPLLSASERRQVLQAIDSLLGVLSAMNAEEYRD
ncbi:hypothetical protein [Streptomyces sp. NPDC046870]|uniref:hypothetical protein n=1 Tax=Streptomyces sp. NPDC046870 TaxID=3155135 RepID=UPI00345562D4